MIVNTNLPNMLYKGKVRDTYDLGSGMLLMIATDRISAFDVVLPDGIPNKGLVLSKISEFWFQKTAHIVGNHLIGMADSDHIRTSLNDIQLLNDVPEAMAKQAMVVRKAQRIDIECIVRGYLAGSAWSEYKKHGTVWGKTMPENLKEGEILPEPMFTPTTKAEEGHDENMSKQEAIDMVGEQLWDSLEQISIRVYEFARDYARSKGIILVDTKMEFGHIDGDLILIDELLTPDSSRFWDADGYSPGSSLPNFDKQFVRDWLNSQGWDHEPPAPSLPEDISRKTSERYLEAYRRLVGKELLSS